jgi:hypothetical protein
MELITEPDIYAPSIDETGKYIDKLPAFFKHGVQCPCGARKEKVYESKPKLKEHLKTKVHQKWLDDMNANRSNHYIEALRNEQIIKEQRIIIAQLERQLITKTKTIDLLTERLIKPTESRELLDLIDF